MRQFCRVATDTLNITDLYASVLSKHIHQINLVNPINSTIIILNLFRDSPEFNIHIKLAHKNNPKASVKTRRFAQQSRCSSSFYTGASSIPVTLCNQIWPRGGAIYCHCHHTRLTWFLGSLRPRTDGNRSRGNAASADERSVVSLGFEDVATWVTTAPLCQDPDVWVIES